MPKLTVRQIANLTGGETRGESDVVVERVRPILDAGPEDLSFLVSADRKAAESSAAGVLLVPTALEGGPPSWIRVGNPYYAISQVLREWFWVIPAPPGISDKTEIAKSAQLGRNVRIGPFVTIGERAVIGDDVIIREGVSIGENVSIGRKTVLFPNVTVYQGVSVGERCIIHSGAVLGSDGFGFATHDGRHHKIPQIGSVMIENDVEIGSGSTIDRGTLKDTIIREGTKIDNLVMIAHNVEVGRHCFFAAQAGIAGSTVIGDYCAFGGQSGAVGHIRIGSHVMVSAMTVISKPVDGPVTLAGVPARPLLEARRNDAMTKKIPEIMKRLASLEHRFEEHDDSKD
ncbi:MAG: UDP-3-O-(3-hydroxymyristoyl)glucosamine N-acyltransferase [Acidobacteria bacterium]|nr:UDP-3-O-(3-hydroxymyristoyl)glucosamine N-acyltransferase [Acidobacteriota bacterium]